MNWIEAVCRTNLDDYDCSQVTRFVAIPNKGDKVEVIHNTRGLRTLEVCSITHKCKKAIINEIHLTKPQTIPYIEVELNKSQ